MMCKDSLSCLRSGGVNIFRNFGWTCCISRQRVHKIGLFEVFTSIFCQLFLVGKSIIIYTGNFGWKFFIPVTNGHHRVICKSLCRILRRRFLMYWVARTVHIVLAH